MKILVFVLFLLPSVVSSQALPKRTDTFSNQDISEAIDIWKYIATETGKNNHLKRNWHTIEGALVYGLQRHQYPATLQKKLSANLSIRGEKHLLTLFLKAQKTEQELTKIDMFEKQQALAVNQKMKEFQAILSNWVNMEGRTEKQKEAFTIASIILFIFLDDPAMVAKASALAISDENAKKDVSRLPEFMKMTVDSLPDLAKKANCPTMLTYGSKKFLFNCQSVDLGAAPDIDPIKILLMNKEVRQLPFGGDWEEVDGFTHFFENPTVLRKLKPTTAETLRNTHRAYQAMARDTAHCLLFFLQSTSVGEAMEEIDRYQASVEPHQILNIKLGIVKKPASPKFKTNIKKIPPPPRFIPR